MTTRFYLSNLPAAWPLDRQERALGPLPPGACVYRDMLSAKDRQGHRREMLAALVDKLLRSTTRKDPAEVTVVAVLGVLDWTEKGLLDCIGRIHDRGGVLRVIEPAMEIRPNSSARELVAAVEAFHLTRLRKPKSEERGRAGADISAKRRWDTATAKLDLIKERWQVGDQRVHRSADLLTRAGVTRNTAIDHIGKRMGPR